MPAPKASPGRWSGTLWWKPYMARHYERRGCWERLLRRGKDWGTPGLAGIRQIGIGLFLRCAQCWARRGSPAYSRQDMLSRKSRLSNRRWNRNQKEANENAVNNIGFREGKVAIR